MTKLKQFEIVFDDNKTTYVPGDIVRGKIIIELIAEMVAKAVKVEFTGVGKVHWEEGSGKSTKHYRAFETYVKETVVLCGKVDASTEDKITLSEGRHSFQFSCQLPVAIPGSFKCQSGIGYVRYVVEAMIVKPTIFDEIKSASFFVQGTLDLSQLRENMLVPTGKSKTKTFCCCCCESQPLELDFGVDKKGFMIGERIDIHANITNASTKNVWKTGVELVQFVTYKTKGHTKVRSRSITRVDGLPCPPNGTLTWENQNMEIPPVQPSKLPHCTMIDISYKLKFTVYVPTGHINLRTSIPIYIGTEMSPTVDTGVDRYVVPPVSNAVITEHGIDEDFSAPPSYDTCTSAAFSDMQTKYYDPSRSDFTFNETAQIPE